MNIYETLIDEIILRLAGTDAEPINFPTIGVEVKKLEDIEGQYNELRTDQAGRITVAFWQERYGTEQDGSMRTVDTANMDKDIYAVITCSSRRQYGPTGTLTYLHLCSGLLLGLRPSFGGEIQTFASEFQEFKNKTWHHRLIVRVVNYVAQGIDNFRGESPLYPGVNITQINWLEDYEGSELTTNLGQSIIIPSEDGNSSITDF